MSKYIIYFGKDPEELDSWCWSDSFDLNDTEKIKAETVAKFETDNASIFWREFMLIRENPPAMWYWVFIDGILHLSGAIDYSDYEILEENGIEMPDWVRK